MQDYLCTCGHPRSQHVQGSSEAGAMLEDGPCLCVGGEPPTGDHRCGCIQFHRAPEEKRLDRHTQALEKLADAATRIADYLEIAVYGDGVAVRR